MFGLSGGHLLVLGVIVLLFGSRRLPELGASLGKGLRAFKDSMEGRIEEDQTIQAKTVPRIGPELRDAKESQAKI